MLNKRRPKRILFRADGNEKTGLGHLTRVAALAQMLDSNRYEFVLYSQNILSSIANSLSGVFHKIVEIKPVIGEKANDAIFFEEQTQEDIIVLDGYSFDTSYQKQCKKNGCRLVCIDDIHSFHFAADVVINQNMLVKQQSYSVENYTKLCLGPDYALLRPSFLKAATGERKNNDTGTVLICIGGGDADNITLQLLKVCCEIEELTQLTVVLGAANTHKESIDEFRSHIHHKTIKLDQNIPENELCLLMQTCKVAIVPSSVISLEACAVGVGLCTGYVAGNQIENYNGLTSRGLASGAGNFLQLDKEDFKNKLRELLTNNHLVREQISRQRNTIDGMSPQRISELIDTL